MVQILQNQPKFFCRAIEILPARVAQITSDHIILQYVKGVRIEFTNNTPPSANEFAAKCCSSQETEIQRLLEKGVIVPSQYEADELISPIYFCYLKKMVRIA